MAYEKVTSKNTSQDQFLHNTKFLIDHATLHIVLIYA
mgnify:CR=1 FL=1